VLRMRLHFLILTLLFAFCSTGISHAQDENVLVQILKEWPTQFDSIIAHKQQYRLQIAYTQVNRDEHNTATLKTYTFDIDSYYYYCASAIKLLEVPLAIEKVNRLKKFGVSIYDSIYIPEYYCKGLSDYALRRKYYNASVAQFGKEIFLVSNNESFNPLYDLLTQEYFNNRLKELGLHSATICGRFAACDSNENRISNPIEFYDRNTAALKYAQPMATNSHVVGYKQKLSPLVGKGVVQGGNVINQPKDFAYSNYVKLSELHTWLTHLMFPKLQHKDKKLELVEEDYAFLRKYMGMFPRESVYPVYNNKDYPDNKMKYFLKADSDGIMPHNLRVYNKVGMAYGFVTDCSYIVDTANKVEFFLSASIYVNRNEILNDGVYEYETVALPFLQHLFSAVYLYELGRDKKHEPKLYDWDFTDSVR
jgi:hypothetical protein